MWLQHICSGAVTKHPNLLNTPAVLFTATIHIKAMNSSALQEKLSDHTKGSSESLLYDQNNFILHLDKLDQLLP